MPYDIIVKKSKQNTIERILNELSDKDKQKVLDVLCNTPKGNQHTHTIIKKVHRNLWQYDVPGNNGYRFIYGVTTKPQKEVHIVFTGNHDDAATFLRNKVKRGKY